MKIKKKLFFDDEESQAGKRGTSLYPMTKSILKLPI